MESSQRMESETSVVAHESSHGANILPAGASRKSVARVTACKEGKEDQRRSFGGGRRNERKRQELTKAAHLARTVLVRVGRDGPTSTIGSKSTSGRAG